ncbi:hypothetical protein CRENPOLYSF2_3620006 [Crenothrix polyspora]|uniref:Uncharacterized protein n=2 Tax=Crenothrix polyspora TaxID=360316 RepID=A0A1R4HC86_9GAMM|nr:hypothetical protein CRENPOLYSF2_3620006 [Crenothrix polyspora]
MLTNEMVCGEWAENIANVKQELEKEVKKLEYMREKLVIAANVILEIKPIHGQKMTTLNLHGHLENLSRNLLSHCLVIKQEDRHYIRAMHRVQKCLAPAKKGKPEPKDCVILEAFLDVAGKAREFGYNGSIFCYFKYQ